jgi:hypothetical protein
MLELSLGNAARATAILEPIPYHLLSLGCREQTVYPVLRSSICV